MKIARSRQNCACTGWFTTLRTSWYFIYLLHCLRLFTAKSEISCHTTKHLFKEKGLSSTHSFTHPLYHPFYSLSFVLMKRRCWELFTDEKRRKLLDSIVTVPSVELDGICYKSCLLYTSPSPRDLSTSRMPSSA